jgi:hypothetical protein
MITQEELEKKIKSYNFKNSTIKQLSIETNLSVRTIKRYMIKLDIPPRKNVIVNIPRDNLGRFSFKQQSCISQKEENNDSNVLTKVLKTTNTNRTLETYLTLWKQSLNYNLKIDSKILLKYLNLYHRIILSLLKYIFINFKCLDKYALIITNLI